MAGLKLEKLSKVYPGEVPACDIRELEVADGELLVLVGPSGSGKTTILRLIAGLEEPTSGSIYLAGRRVNDLPPRRRNVAMVFQSQAIYPHWSVYKNLAFGPELRELGWRRRLYQRLARPLHLLMGGEADARHASSRQRLACSRELRERVRQTAALLEIEALLERRGSELSGGEEQRVALGRAILRRPALFLFDEPLSSLDVQLRVELRRQLKRLHTRLGATMIYVTHDQSEALALADRIAVLKEGKIEQIGTPREVYERPANRFVAGFMGTSPMNFFQALTCGVCLPPACSGAGETPTPQARSASTGGDGAWQLSAHEWRVAVGAGWWHGGSEETAVVGLRPEDILLRRPEEPPPAGNLPCAAATVTLVEYQGDACLAAVVPRNTHESEKEASQEWPGAVLLGKALVRSGLKPGEHIIAWCDMRRAHWFDGKSGRNLRPTSAT